MDVPVLVDQQELIYNSSVETENLSEAMKDGDE